MAQRLHPDVYVEEIGGRPTLLGVGTGTGSFIGTAPSGPTNVAVLVTNYAQYESTFGPDGGNLDEAVKAFFDNGGTRCYVIRVVGTGALAASASLDDMDADARYVGTEMNGATITTTRYTCLIDPSDDLVSATGTEVDLVDASNVEIGDIINFWDGAAWVEVHVVDIVGNKIYHAAVTFSGTVNGVTTQTYPGVCATTHKISTRVNGVLSNGVAVTQLTLQSIGALEIGDAVSIVYWDSVGGAAYQWTRRITAINGNIVTIDSSITPGADMTPYVASLEFSVVVSNNGVVIEDTLDNLSASAQSPRFYGTIVNATTGSQNISQYVELSYTGGGSSVGDNIPFNMASPYDGSAVAMAGGNAGGTPSNDDYIGTQTAPRTGMGLLEDVREVNMLSVPGVTTEAVILEGVRYCEIQRGTISYIYAGPAGYNPTQIKQWRSQVVNVDSSHAILLYPWYNIDDGLGGNKLISPDGAFQGIWARVAGQQNISVAPANVVVANAKSLEYDVSNGEQDILNPLGINCIRDFGTRGIRIWGVRTLTSLTDGRHYTNVRGLLNFIKATVFEGTQWAVFKNSDPKLWGQIRNVVTKFLRGLWQEGMLYPSDDMGRAFYVKCDAENNPEEVRNQGKVVCEIGVNPPLPAEFVVFKIGLWDGGGSITETV